MTPVAIARFVRTFSLLGIRTFAAAATIYLVLPAEPASATDQDSLRLVAPADTVLVAILMPDDPDLPDRAATFEMPDAEELLASLPAREEGIRPWRLALISGGAAAGAFAVMDAQRQRWWHDRSPTFRIMNDWEYVRWADKFGHVFSTSFFSRLYYNSFRWSGMSEDRAHLWGAVAGWTQLLYYEILDGFGPEWGFSPGDFLFNTVGAAFTYAQWREPYLEAFDLKVSYWPSGWEGKNFTDDYKGQTWWVTANLNQALPGEAGDVFPPWLNLAVGYGARDLDEREFLTTSYVYLGLDFELRGLPIDHPVWNAIVEWLRYLHLPAPAIRLTPRPALLLFAY